VNSVISLVAVVVFFLVGMLAGGMGVPFLFGVILPYLAVALFVVGLVYRVMCWANIPVPFRIPTTCGQQKSLPWIKPSAIDNPHSASGVVARMALEVLFFRSLLRNSDTVLHKDGKLNYVSNIALWLGAMTFHWAMLIILLRHLRFFIEPVPTPVWILHEADGFTLMQVFKPALYISSLLFLGGLGYLLFRRFASSQVRYISLAGDYFALFLLLGIGASGLWLRHLDKTDITGIKELAIGLVTFSPVVKATISPLFFGHLFLVCVLLAYFPFSKLLHMAGVFLSPTRNMSNNNRAVRHVNPWDYEVKTHSYEEYEDEFREKMKAAGIPVDKE